MTLKGLDPLLLYNVSLKMVPADCHHYQYIRRRWHVTGLSDIVQDKGKLTVAHSRSPETGQFWMENPVSFSRVKVTNHDPGRSGMVRIRSQLVCSHLCMGHIVCRWSLGSTLPFKLAIDQPRFR